MKEALEPRTNARAQSLRPMPDIDTCRRELEEAYKALLSKVEDAMRKKGTKQ